MVDPVTPAVFPPCAAFEKPYDLDIVRKIVEREGCIEALQQLLKPANDRPSRTSGTLAAPMVMKSIVDQLRSVTLEIIEAIEEWHGQQQAKAQATTFRWRGVNYLLKITGDLDFLASFRGDPLLEGLQALRLKQNPFLTSVHLDHPAYRERDPDTAFQWFDNWANDFNMHRIFSASKVLLRERDADARRLKLRCSENGESTRVYDNAHDHERYVSVAEVAPIAAKTTVKHPPKGSSSRLMSPVLSRGEHSNGLSAAVAVPRSQENAMQEDIELSRELIAKIEHELGALKDEIAPLKEQLEDVMLLEKRRPLQNRIGSLINEIKFRTGDLYQRKNELRRKEAMYRGTIGRCERMNNGDASLTYSRSMDRTKSNLPRPTFHEQPANGKVIHSPLVRKAESVYSSLFEKTLQEDEQIRNKLVQQVNASLAQLRAELKQSVGLPSTSHQSQKLVENLSEGHPSQQNRLRKSDDIQGWGVCDVQDFLDSLRLDNGTYGATFRAKGIDGMLLMQANDRDLEELGISIRLHRVRILQECRMHRTNSSPQQTLAIHCQFRQPN